MGYSTDVPDGATQRHSRLMELITLINLSEPHGVSITQIQSHMLNSYGLKFRTTSEMVKELTISGSLMVDGYSRFHLTGRQATFLKAMEPEKPAEKPPEKPKAPDIEQIKDPQKKAKALELQRQLAELLEQKEEGASEPK
jgi:hypothetical protein